jgi:hypothetical protein
MGSKRDISWSARLVVFVLIQDMLSMAVIHRHRDTSGFSAALSIRIFHNAACSVILLVPLALFAESVRSGLSR